MSTCQIMPDPLTVISVILTSAGLLYNESSRVSATKSAVYDKKADVYDEKARKAAEKAEKATKISLGREFFIREISGKFKTIGNQTNHLEKLQEILTQLESRITSILSDYTSLLNQISIVATLMLGVATAVFGTLLGNTEDQPMWKIKMYVISCVLSICFSIISVIESFFLSIHIYAEESKFTAGLYPHRSIGTRTFNLNSLKGLSKSYSASIVTFFMSFLFFSTSLLSMVYIGLGKSMYILGEDNRYYKETTDRFTNSTVKKLSEVEPGYTGIAFTMTIFVVLTYLVIIVLFITKYRKYILWPRNMLECCGIDKESLKEPMKETAQDFERIQLDLHTQFKEWERLFRLFTQGYDEIFDQQHWENRDLEREPSSEDTHWNYTDVEYEIYVYQSFREQLSIQRKMLIQMRMLQVTDKQKRRELNFISTTSTSKVETKSDGYNKGGYLKMNQIYF